MGARWRIAGVAAVIATLCMVVVVLLDRQDTAAETILAKWHDSWRPSRIQSSRGVEDWGFDRDATRLFAEEPSSGWDAKGQENRRSMEQLQYTEQEPEVDSDASEAEEEPSIRPSESLHRHLSEEDLEGLSPAETRTVLHHLATQRRALEEQLRHQQAAQQKQEARSDELNNEYEVRTEQAYQIAAAAQKDEADAERKLDARFRLESKTGYDAVKAIEQEASATRTKERQHKAASRLEVERDEEELETEQTEDARMKARVLAAKYYKEKLRKETAKAAEQEAFMRAASEKGSKEGLRAIQEPRATRPKTKERLQQPVGKSATRNDPEVLRMQQEITRLEGALATQKKRRHLQTRLQHLRLHAKQQHRREQAEKLQLQEMEERMEHMKQEVVAEQHQRAKAKRTRAEAQMHEDPRPSHPTVLDGEPSVLSTTSLTLHPKRSTKSEVAGGDSTASLSSSSFMKNALRSIKKEADDTDPSGKLPEARAKAQPEIPHTENSDDAEWAIIEYSIWGTVGALGVGLCGVIIYCACKQPRDRPWGMPPKRQF